MLNINSLMLKIFENLKINKNSEVSLGDLNMKKLNESIFNFDNPKSDDSNIGLTVSKSSKNNIDINAYQNQVNQAISNAKSKMAYLQKTQYPTEQDLISETESRISLTKLAYNLEQQLEEVTGEDKVKLQSLISQLNQVITEQDAIRVSMPIKSKGKEEAELYLSVIGDDRVAYARFNEFISKTDSVQTEENAKILKNEISQEKIIYDGLEQKIKESEDLKEIINTRRTGLEGCIEKLNKKFDNTENNV